MITPLICPFTKTIISLKNQIGSYIRWTTKEKGISSVELRHLIFLETFLVAEESIFTKLYVDEKYSLPDFYNKFGMTYGTTEFLIEKYGIHKRSHSEAGKISAIKTKETMMERYGVDHTFKVPEFQAKREQSFLNKYGVDNPFKIKDFLKIYEESFVENFGMSLRELRSVQSKEVWAKKTEEERKDWVKKSIWKDDFTSPKRPGNSSKLEKRFIKNLVDFEIPFSTQFEVNGKYFDVYFPQANLLLEINGTVWHGDPEVFQADDIMPISKISAKDLWERDGLKRKGAEDQGYTVITIWERELHLLTPKEAVALLYFKIQEKTNNEHP